MFDLHPLSLVDPCAYQDLTYRTNHHNASGTFRQEKTKKEKGTSAVLSLFDFRARSVPSTFHL